MIRRIDVRSKVLEVDTYFLIAAPDGQDGPLPAVVLYRGLPEEWLNESQDETREGRTLLTVMDDLLQKDFAAPLAFILPRTVNETGDAYVSYGTARRPDLIADRSYLGTCRMDAFLDEEVLPMAFDSGLVVPDKVSIDGFSLGGAASIQHALRRPDYFCSLGSYDGALLEYAFDNPEVTPDTPSDLRFDWFPYLHGFPPDEEAFRATNALDVVTRGELHLPRAMLHYASEHSPQENGWRMQAFLERSRVHNHEKHPTMSPLSAHTWWWADEHLYRTIPFHSSALYAGG